MQGVMTSHLLAQTIHGVEYSESKITNELSKQLLSPLLYVAV